MRLLHLSLVHLSLLLLASSTLLLFQGCASPERRGAPERPPCPPLSVGVTVSALGSNATNAGNGRFVEERDGWIKLVDASSDEAGWAHWIQCSQVTTITVTE